MATELFRLVKTASQTSPEAPIRPAKSNFNPINVVVDGTFAAGTITIQVSPTIGLNDWQTHGTAFTVAGNQQILYPWERVRAITNASFSSVVGVNVYIVPGA